MAKKKTTVFRNPYYELSDKIEGLKRVAKQKKDRKLISLLNKMTKINSEIYATLDKKYIWD